MVRFLTAVLVATVVAITPSCSLGDEEVCAEFSDDVLRATNRAVADAGPGSTEELGQEQVDRLYEDLAAGVYEVEVHRDQLGCDRDALADQVCPRLGGIEPGGPVGEELLTSIVDGYACDDT